MKKTSKRIILASIIILTLLITVDLLRGSKKNYSAVEHLACTLFTSKDYAYAYSQNDKEFSIETCIPLYTDAEHTWSCTDKVGQCG